MTESQHAASGNPFRAILDVGAALVSSLDLDDVFDNVACRIGEAMVVWGVDIETYDSSAQTLRREACWRLDDGDAEALGSADRETLLSRRPGLRQVVIGREMVELRLDDPGLEPGERERLTRCGHKSSLYAPLCVGHEVLGVLGLVERRFVRRFTSIERDLFRQLCDLASIAIHNARLYRTMDEQKRHMVSLLETSRALTSSLVLEEVMTIVAPRVAAALRVDSADIYEYRAGADCLDCVATWSPDGTEEEQAYVGTVLELDDHPSFKRALERPEVIEYHLDDPELPGLDPELHCEMQRWGEQSVMEVGMFFGHEPIGLISLCCRDEARRLDADEEALLIALASSASMAIHNAKAYRIQQEQTRQLGALLDAARTITSTVVLDEVLARVATEASAALQTTQAAVYEYNAADDTYTFHAFHEGVPSADSVSWLGVAYPLADNPTDRETLFARAPKVEHLSDPDLPPDRLESLRDYGEKTVLSIPLHFGDTSLGILRLYETERERIFSATEIELAAGLGEQAAIAINNARLYRELDEQRRQLDSLLAVSRALTSTRDGAEVCEVIARTGAEAFGAPRAIIYEHDEAEDALTARAFFEHHRIQGYASVGVSRPLDETPADRLVLESPGPLVEQLSDMTLHPTTRNEMQRWGETTCLNVPMRLTDRCLGILMLLWTDEERHFNAGELEFARALGEQAAIALHNSAVTQAARRLDERDDLV
jgi:GAF domain-containing protein